MIHCYYNNHTLDGQCLGAVVKYKYPDAVLHKSNGGQQILDFEEEDGVREVNSSEEVWEMLFHDRPVPLAVKLLSLYDSNTFQGHELEDMVLPFQIRMRMEELDPKDWERCSGLWKEFFENPEYGISISALIADGELLLRYDQAQKEKFIKEYAFETILDTTVTNSMGYMVGGSKFKAIAVNLGHTNSKVFDSVWRRKCQECKGTGREICDNPDHGLIHVLSFHDIGRIGCPGCGHDPMNRTKDVCNYCKGTGYIEPYDLMIPFVRRKDKLWNVGFYSTKEDVDCGAIAQSFGGGGHKGAAGCQCKDLPFEY